MQQLKTEALAKLAAFTKSAEYPALLKNLIVQGLIKIEEPEVQIQARAEDKALVARVVRDALMPCILAHMYICTYSMHILAHSLAHSLFDVCCSINIIVVVTSSIVVLLLLLLPL